MKKILFKYAMLVILINPNFLIYGMKGLGSQWFSTLAAYSNPGGAQVLILDK